MLGLQQLNLLMEKFQWQELPMSYNPPYLPHPPPMEHVEDAERLFKYGLGSA